MTPRPYVLAECAYGSLRGARHDVALLPWGATEAHNLHLPYGTDTIESAEVAARAAALAWEMGARPIVLPAIPFGVQTGQRDIPFCINVNPSTQGALLGDVARSIAPHGVRALVIVNGHGGNDFRPMIRELQPAVGIFLCTLDWWRAVDAGVYFVEPGDHAGELETSVTMALAPDLVRPLADAGSGAARRFRPRALREGWAWAQREWTRVTSDTGVGDPSQSTPEAGRRFVDAAARRIADFIAELAAALPDGLYE